MHPTNDLVDDLVLRHATSSPERTAVVEDAATISYGDLATRIENLAAGLKEAGIFEGQSVGLILPNGIDFIASLLALARIGARAVPLSPGYRRRELRRYIVGFDVRTLLVDDSVAALAAQLTEAERPVDVIVARDGKRSLRAMMATAGRTSAVTKPGPDAAFVYQFSSGTTGLSKRVGRSTATLLAEAESLRDGMGLTPADVVLGVVPMFHTYGLGDAILAPLFAGASIVIARQFRPEAIAHLVSRERVSVFPGVPFMYAMLAETELPPGSLRTLRLCLSAGAPLAKDVFDRCKERLGITVRQQFGTTEIGAATIQRARDLGGERWASVGCPLAGVEVQVWNDAAEPVGVGETGHVAVRSPAMATTYLGAPPEVNEASFKRGFFLTGDLGSLDAEGALTLAGRTKKFIDTVTHKVDPVEVEEVLRQHPMVANAVVVGVPSEHGQENVKALVVARAAIERVTEAALREHCREHLADFKVPTLWEFRAAVPTNPLGKVLRKDVVEPPSTRPPLAWGAATDEIETIIARLFAEALGLPEPTGPEEDFYALGGSSVTATALVAMIEKALGVRIPISTVFGNCSTRTLAAAVRTAMNERRKKEHRRLLVSRLGAMWRAELGVETIGPKDDFVALGGTPANAAALAETIARETAVTIPVSAFKTGFTIDVAADTIAKAQDAGATSSAPRAASMTVLEKRGDRPPLVLFHSAVGFVLEYLPLVRLLEGERPVLGLQNPQIHGADWHRSVGAAADAYAAHVAATFPDGPVHLAGFSLGACLAFEVAARLGDRGAVVMVDPFHWGNRWSAGADARLPLDELREPLDRSSSARLFCAELERVFPDVFPPKSLTSASPVDAFAKVKTFVLERTQTETFIGAVADSLDPRIGPDALRVLVGNALMGSRYAPGPAPDRDILAIAADDNPMADAWAAHVGPRMRLVKVGIDRMGHASSHAAMLLAANASRYVVAIRDELRRRDS